MNTDTARRPFVRTLVLMLLAVALAVIGTSGASADTHRRAAASSVGGPITGSEILARAQNWADRGITYTQTGAWASDVDGGHTYRRDCSGLVSMAWHLGSSLITHEFLNKARNNDGMHVISLGALQPGDAMVRDSDGAGPDGHMELFSHWVNPADHGQGAYVYSFNSDGETVRNPYRANNVGLLGKNSDSEMRTYTAIRYNKTVGAGGVNHRVRNADGSWSPFGALSLNASQVAVAADPGARTHVLAVTNGQLFHRLRAADGSWTPWGQLGNPGTASSVSASTDDGGNLHVAFIADGTLYHRLRYASDGSWTTSNLVGAPTGTTATNISIAIDTRQSIAHVTTVANGQLFHRVRNTDSTWTPWGPLGNSATAVSTATDTNGDLHLTLVTNGTTYHRLRNNNADGTWTSTNLLGTPTGTATAISAASDPTNDTLHVTTIANGQLFHRIRNADTTWTPWGQLGNPGTATALSTTVDPTQTLHVTATY